ncbi:MAG: hypothetical protein JST47_01260 [Bacteroidetes bacterium]|nr:hypothetical protein [Bacteroidota bacterium]
MSKNIEILIKATGKLLLFDEPVGKYRYSLYVTNLGFPAEQICGFQDYMIAYNLMSLSRQIVLNPKSQATALHWEVGSANMQGNSY